MHDYESQNLIDAFDHLNQSLYQFRNRLLQSERSTPSSTKYWALGHKDTPISLSEITELLTNIWYRSKGDGRRTDNLYGLIGAPPELIPLLHQLNNTKNQFQIAVKLFKDKQGDPSSLLHKRAQTLNLGMQKTGLARLHLKQCYRQIPVLDTRPQKILFSWYTSGRSMKKLSVSEAEKRLLKMDISQLHIQLQLEALAKIPDSEPLVQLQQQVPIMRANILWNKDGQKIRKARNCPLPIFFPLDDNEALPEYNTPSLIPPETRQRQQRSDLIIDPEPYLPSLRIHRYR